MPAYDSTQKIFFSGEITTRDYATRCLQSQGLSQASIDLFHGRVAVADVSPEVQAAFFAGDHNGPAWLPHQARADPTDHVTFRFCSKDTPGAIVDANGRAHLPPRGAKGKGENAEGSGGGKKEKQSGRPSLADISRKVTAGAKDINKAVVKEKAIKTPAPKKISGPIQQDRRLSQLAQRQKVHGDKVDVVKDGKGEFHIRDQKGKSLKNMGSDDRQIEHHLRRAEEGHKESRQFIGLRD